MQRALAPLVLAVVLSSALHAAKIPISGKVVDAAGKPVEAARILLIPIPTLAESGRSALAGHNDPEPAVTAITGASGAFQIVAPHNGMWKVRVESRTLVPVETLLAPLVDKTDLPDARLSPDASFKVTVTDAAGKPADGARVRLADARRPGSFGAGWSAQNRLATTGADGTAFLPRAADEDLTVTVGRADFPVTERKSVLGASASFRVAVGQGRHLQVRDAEGKAVPGVVVWQDGWAVGQTSESGRADFALPDAGGAVLRLAADDGRALDFRLRDAAKGAQDAPDLITLPATVLVTRKVVSSTDSRPLAGAVAWLAGDLGSAVRTGADGSFRILAAPQSTFVKAAAAGFFGREVSVDGTHRSLELNPCLAVTGVVVDEAGRPLPGASLTATLIRGKEGTLPSFDFFESGGFRRSGPEGRFHLANLAPEAVYGVRIELEGFAPVQTELPAREAGQATPELRVVMRAGEETFGVVLDANHTAIAGARVRLRLRTGDELGAQIREALKKPTDDFETTSDAKGHFSLRHLPPARFDLIVNAKGFAPHTVADLAVSEGRGASDLGTVVLSPGAVLAGKVVDAEGRPVEGAAVRAANHESPGRNLRLASLNAGTADAVTAADGSFRLEDRAPGEALDLGIRHPGYGPVIAQGVASPAGEPLRIALQPTARLSGRVLGTDGKGLAGAKVSLIEVAVESGSLTRLADWKQTTAGEDGAFSFSGVAPGAIEVRASTPDLQLATLKGLEAKPGQELAGVELIPVPIATTAAK